MSTKQYEMWIKKHRMQAEEFDVTDSVMEKLISRGRGPGIFQKTWELFLLEFVQAKVWRLASVLATGVLAGLVRMVFIVYCGLFA